MHLPVCEDLYVCVLHLGVPVCECWFMVLVCIFVHDNSMHVCVCMLGQAYVSVHLCIICDLCPNVCVCACAEWCRHVCAQGHLSSWPKSRTTRGSEAEAGR